jgi:lysozyme
MTKNLCVFLFIAFSTFLFAKPLPTLQRDVEGFEVTLLQKLLRKIGYDVMLNGRFDAQTESAVKRFQADEKMFAHGMVNDSTWNLLFNHKFVKNVSLRGVDISHYENEVYKNGAIPFELLKQYDIEFCYSKATHGAIRKDEWFEYNWSKCQEQHIIRGAYHFFSLLNDDIDAQINNFLNLNIDYKQAGVLPPVLDVEEDARPFNKENIVLNRELVVARVKIWVQAIESATGVKPMIYTRKSFWEDVLGNPTGFEDYPLWVAYYREDTPPKAPSTWNGKWHFWQHTDREVLKGAGKFDMNRFNGGYKELLEMANIEF